MINKSKPRGLLVWKFWKYLREEPSVCVFALCFYSGLTILMRWAKQKNKKEKQNAMKNLQNQDVSLNIDV